jgi:hypothetical protein
LAVIGLALFGVWAVGAYANGRDPLLILLQVVGMVLAVVLLRLFVTARKKHIAWGWNLVIILGTCVAVVGLASLSLTTPEGAAKLTGYTIGYALIPSIGLTTMYAGLYPKSTPTQPPPADPPRH